MWDRLFIIQLCEPFQQMTTSTHHSYPSTQQSMATSKSIQRNRLCRFPYTSMIVLTLLLLTILIADFQGSVDAFVRPSGKAGLLKLCPPGGESFATAWQITCGMRRRKKRETELEQDTTTVASPLSSTSTQTTNSSQTKIDEGAEDSVQAIAGAALTNPEPLLKSSSVDSLPSGQGTKRKRSAWANELLQYDPVSHMGQNPQQQIEAKDEALYRAPSMTEMMMVCCRYGCSLRDLLPYCDPFGQWDS